MFNLHTPNRPHQKVNTVEFRDDHADKTIKDKSSIDPDFDEPSACLHSDMLQDWMSILIKENRQRIENVTDSFRIFFHPKTVQYLFTICLRLRLPQDVKYIAIEIFNEFMISHVSSLYTMISTLPNRSSDQKHKEWEKVESTISRQLSLRVLSCIQVASKIHSYNDSLCVKRVRRCLQTLGLSYTEDAVKKSELRVLTTIGFCANVRQNPATYLESILKLLLIKESNKDFKSNAIWEYSLLVLDCVFLRLTEVYNRILVVVHGKEAVNLPRDRMLRIQSDYVLLSAGIVATASVCVHGMDFTDTIIPTLSKITNISTADILDTSAGIMKSILDPETSTMQKNNTPLQNLLSKS